MYTSLSSRHPPQKQKRKHWLSLNIKRNSDSSELLQRNLNPDQNTNKSVRSPRATLAQSSVRKYCRITTHTHTHTSTPLASSINIPSPLEVAAIPRAIKRYIPPTLSLSAVDKSTDKRGTKRPIPPPETGYIYQGHKRHKNAELPP